MLFNSFSFLLIFLPITFLGFFLLGSMGLKQTAILFLVLASLAFYSYWNPRYLPLLVTSILVNYSLGRLLHPDRFQSKEVRLILLCLGISLNLLVLGYFKYAGFFISVLNLFSSRPWQIQDIVLPLAISFFTITQIAYLVDSFCGETTEYSLLDYSLFVSTFPHLIAGPIVHHKKLAPQFQEDNFFKLQPKNVCVGLTIFIIGLAKKVLVADQVSPYVDATFALTHDGQIPYFGEAWVGILAFLVQIYYDFSGYSEMAIGLGLMFNLRLPINFASPYQAVNISDLWRRWHITLSQFLREYFFTPYALLTTRKGWKGGVYPALVITMLLAGIWHGAGLNYILFGLLMGIFIAIHYYWQNAMKDRKKKITSKHQALLAKTTARVLTFFCILITWVIFRADTPYAAWLFFQGMFSVNGQIAFGAVPHNLGFSISDAFLVILPWLTITLFFPNTLWWIGSYETNLELDKKLISQTSPRLNFLKWKPSITWGVIMGVLTVITLVGMSTTTIRFIYFQF